MPDENQKPVQTGGEFVDTDIREGITNQKPVFIRSTWIRAGTAAVLTLVMSAGISAMISHSFQRQTVVFDMKGTIDAFKQQTAQMALTKEKAEGLTKRFGEALNNSLTSWQLTHSSVILVKGAVVSGVQDITPEIQADIAQQMQEAQ